MGIFGQDMADYVESALVILGGKGHLAEIYTVSSKVCANEGRCITRQFEATVRNTLQQHDETRGRQLFCRIARGYWGLQGAATRLSPLAPPTPSDWEVGLNYRLKPSLKRDEFWFGRGERR